MGIRLRTMLFRAAATAAAFAVSLALAGAAECRKALRYARKHGAGVFPTERLRASSGS